MATLTETLQSGVIKMVRKFIKARKTVVKISMGLLLLTSCFMLSGCSSSVGVGMSIGIPVGNHGHISIGTGRSWY
jgi:hypothetical protein